MQNPFMGLTGATAAPPRALRFAYPNWWVTVLKINQATAKEPDRAKMSLAAK
jgi:hypothetical protein